MADIKTSISPNGEEFSLSTFNLRARYDDYEMEFKRKCTREFTAE